MTQATKRPWEIQEPYYNEALLAWTCFIQCPSEAFKPCMATGETREKCLANARLIVKAVNSHDELVEALKALLFAGTQSNRQFAEQSLLKAGEA